MATSRALARLSGFASRATRGALPLARRTWSSVQGVADEVTLSLLGRDFEERLKRVPVPRAELEATITAALKNHICRCTGYVRYYQAVRDVILATPGLPRESA